MDRETLTRSELSRLFNYLGIKKYTSKREVIITRNPEDYSFDFTFSREITADEEKEIKEELEWICKEYYYGVIVHL